MDLLSYFRVRLVFYIVDMAWWNSSFILIEYLLSCQLSLAAVARIIRIISWWFFKKSSILRFHLHWPFKIIYLVGFHISLRMIPFKCWFSLLFGANSLNNLFIKLQCLLFNILCFLCYMLDCFLYFGYLILIVLLKISHLSFIICCFGKGLQI